MSIKTQIVGVVNITPDSFSDGGEFLAPEAALARIAQCIEEGAKVVDIGAESTRPGATPLTAQQEWVRLEPVLEASFERYWKSGVVFSIDSRHPQTVKSALALGVGWVNDVTGFTSPQMVDVVKDADCKLVVMHSLSVPANPAVVLPAGVDPVALLIAYGWERIDELERQGISKDRIIFDPGVGFGKTAEQSMLIITQAERFSELGVPLLIGHSRKSFLSLITDATRAARDEATLHLSRGLIAAGVEYLRVHDVKNHVALAA